MADAWYLPFDGVDDRIELTTASFGFADTILEWTGSFDALAGADRGLFQRWTSPNTGTLIICWYDNPNGLQVQIKTDGSTNLVTTDGITGLSASTIYRVEVRIRNAVSVDIDVYNANTGAFVAGDSTILTGTYASITGNFWIGDSTFVPRAFDGNFYRFRVLTGGGSTVLYDYFNNINGSQAVLPELISSDDGTLQNFAVTPPWVLYDDGTGGALNITGATTNYSYAAISATVDLTGVINITGATASYSYASVSGTVDLAGAIEITGATSTYSYSPVSATVDLTAELTVTGQTQTYSYSPVPGSVEFSGLITVNGETTSYSYASVPGSVLLQGAIEVTGATGLYTYQAIDARVIFNAQKAPVLFTGNLKETEYSDTEITAAFDGSIKAALFSGKIPTSNINGAN